MATRTITVNLRDTSDKDYVRIANAIWALLDITEVDYGVVPDDRADYDALNDWWENTGRRW